MLNLWPQLVPYPIVVQGTVFFPESDFNRLICCCRYDYSGYGRSTGKVPFVLLFFPLN
jgi:hypothetical protein